MKFIKNTNLLQGFENYRKYYDYDHEWQQELAFLTNIILGDGSNYDNIPEDFIFEDYPCNIIWFNKKKQDNRCFVKFATSEEIYNSDFSWIKNTKEFVKNNKELIDEIDTINDQSSSKDITNYYVYVSIDDEEISRDSIASLKYKFNDKTFKDDNDIIIFRNISDVLSNYNNVYISKLYIDSFKINIYNENPSNNYLEFSNNFSLITKSYIFSVSAKSIKNIYKKYKSSCLNLNLRFYRNQKSVDNKIKNSIVNSNYFWQLNNGLVILCSDIDIDGDSIILHKFSIINGGQTTYNISHTSFDTDFYLLAKIICIKDWDNDKNNTFNLANEIAIASNNQKKINNKDLISNLPSINSLRQAYFDIYDELDYKIYLETKSGSYKQDELSKIRYEAKNVVSIELMLQIYWSIVFCEPDVKSAKAKIYKKEDQIETVVNDIEKNAIVFSQIVLLFNLIEKIKKKKYLSKINDFSLPLVKYFGLYLLTIFKFLINFSKNDNLANQFYNNFSSITFKDFIKINKNNLEIPSTFLKKSFLKANEKEQIDILIKFFNGPIIYFKGRFLDFFQNDKDPNWYNRSKKNDSLPFFIKIFYEFFTNNQDFRELLKGFLDI